MTSRLSLMAHFAGSLVISLSALVQAASAGELLAVNRVRLLAAPGHEAALVGGTIRGSDISADEGFENLAEIKSAPEKGQWVELSFPNNNPYRWIRYQAPAGSFGWISKIDFYAGQQQLHGEVIGSYPIGSWRRALDDRPAVAIQGDKADDQFVGLDVGDRASCPRPTFSPAGGAVAGPVSVAMHCRVPGAKIRYTTDGTLPTADRGEIYSAPVSIDKTTTFTAVAFCKGMAPSPEADNIYLIGPVAKRHTLHFGNSLSGNAVGKFALHAKTAGILHETTLFGMGGAITRSLWNVAMIGAPDPSDDARFRELFTNMHSMGGVNTYPLDTVQASTANWKRLWPGLSQITDVTFQPRDADVAEEADYTMRWLKVVREKFPQVQPWLYVEWTERDRHRATDLGQLPSSQMAKVFPALTWEESMSAMLLYGEEVQLAISKLDKEGRPVRIIPTCLALGWIHNQIERGTFPDLGRDSFESLLFSDKVHVNTEGSYLVELTWFSALYGRSPEATFLPLRSRLTPRQAAAMQQLAWEVIKNYPDCGYYQPGTTPAGKPEFSASSPAGKEVIPVDLKSATPGAWFRYTLDGTVPTRSRGYVYCGRISLRPGMTLKAIAYKSGMADSDVSETSYGDLRIAPATVSPQNR